ncbi:hypothetical protein [Caballeronia calidae]|uniref:hypothetical protein n=1 Tax=Caballeronia calidae TaxID=1777139 RepID=UPI0012FDF5AC|nr:hypothetical protein [Caballeronia calidae]
MSRLIAASSRFAEISAAAVSPSVVRKTGERRFAFFSRSMAGPIQAGIRLMAGRRRFSPIKFFLTKNPLPTGDRLDRTRLWAPSLPVISPCVQLVALDFPGEQPTVGASKITVYRLHLYSLINLGRCLILSVDLFRLFANYIQNE